MSRKEMLTASAIDALKEGVLHDPQTLGLSIFVSPNGNKVWRYRRRITDLGKILDLRLGNYPTHSIAAARVWTQDLNTKVEAGIDPRIEAREEEKRRRMTVARAHALYMIAVRQGRATTARKPNKPRTIQDKLGFCQTCAAHAKSTGWHANPGRNHPVRFAVSTRHPR